MTEHKSELLTLLGHAKGRPWITGRDPACYNDRDISCVRLTQADLDLLCRALTFFDDAKADTMRVEPLA